MDFRDLNGEPLSVGDPVTLVGNVFKQGYLNGANGTVIRFGESLVKVSVRNLRGEERERTVRPENLQKGHHGINPGENAENKFHAELENAFADFATLHVRALLDYAVRERHIDQDQRDELEGVSGRALARGPRANAAGGNIVIPPA